MSGRHANETTQTGGLKTCNVYIRFYKINIVYIIISKSNVVIKYLSDE